MKKREVRCINEKCAVLNRVGVYSLVQIPICRVCEHPLPESTGIKLIRFGMTNSFFWMAVATWIAVVGFLFLDRYAPTMGVVWNIINGTISGYPYREVLAIAAALFLFGCYIRARPGKPPS
jgi:hypothetical protein